MRTKTHFKTRNVALVSVVGFEHVRTLFDSTQSQESKSDISLCNRTRQCALRPILRPPLYLWCPWSNLDMWHHFLHLQNLRNPNLILSCTTKHGNAHRDLFKTQSVSLCLSNLGSLPPPSNNHPIPQFLPPSLSQSLNPTIPPSLSLIPIPPSI